MELTIIETERLVKRLREVEACTSIHTLTGFDDRFLASWIYHDLCVEGWVFRDNEIQRALEGREGTTYLEIQLIQKIQHLKLTIEFVRRQAMNRESFSLEFIKEIHRRLCSDVAEKGGRYRKETGETRVYRHEMIPSSAISYRLRRLVSYVEQEAEDEHPIRAACQIHKQLMDIFPFASDNGIVARLAMNNWLIRHGFPPAVVTIHERQRYFDTYLVGNGEFQRFVLECIQMVVEARLKGLRSMAPVIPMTVRLSPQFCEAS
jgi:fido (protein-threonine AMPylation protein)